MSKHKIWLHSLRNQFESVTYLKRNALWYIFIDITEDLVDLVGLKSSFKGEPKNLQNNIQAYL